MEKSKLLYSNNYINIYINSKYIHWKSHNTKCTSEELEQLINVSNTILDKLYNEKKNVRVNMGYEKYTNIISKTCKSNYKFCFKKNKEK